VIQRDDGASSKGLVGTIETPSKLMVLRRFRADEPGFQLAVLTEKVL